MTKIKRSGNYKFLAAAGIVLLIIGSCKKDKSYEIITGDELTGVIFAPDGVTPIAGATVYVPQDPSPLKTATVIEAEDCNMPDESYLTYTCTGANGSFSLDISEITEESFTLRVVKGSFHADIPITSATGSNLGSINLPADPALGGGKFAVVTGYYDRMQDILAKLGMGEIDDYHELITGTELFDLYDGDFTLYDEYPSFLTLFEIDPLTDLPVIENYEMVFINCGNEYEYVLEESATISLLRNYVSGGGKLYVTDQSYDFVEQVFPEYIDFLGSGEIAETEPEYMNEAEVGVDGIESNATIKDAQLDAWMQTVNCEGGSCLNAGNTVRISGFWIGWTVMNKPHTGKAGQVKVWIEGPVSWDDYDTGTGSGVKPLTVSFSHGLGKVLYSSYHTEEDNPSAGFWPQERILQYLVFEL